MAREQRLNRDANTKKYNPTRVIIASEGKSTEIDYFNGIKDKIPKRFENNFTIITIDRGDDNSSPSNVLHCAENFITNLNPKINPDTDEVCIIVDLDNWPASMLSRVLTLCKQKKYLFLVSNPCFELWLLLHHLDCSSLSQEEKNIIMGKQRHPRRDKQHPIKTRLSSIISGYNCSKINIDQFFPHISTAVENAKKLDNQSEDWPNDLGTKVHVIIEKIPGIID